MSDFIIQKKTVNNHLELLFLFVMSTIKIPPPMNTLQRL